MAVSCFTLALKTEENWHKDSNINFSNKDQVVEWFTKEYNGWDMVWRELFENTNSGFVPRPQYCMPLDQTWESLPNLTMLGDAAHLMPPYAGEGVNMAMLDALELRNCLVDDSYRDVKSAITAYEYQMRSRAYEIAGITMESTAALHSTDAISFLLEIIA